MTDDREIARWKHRAETAEARLAVFNSGGFADADALAAQFITLTAERDALAERADALHKALRIRCIGSFAFGYRGHERDACTWCDRDWKHGEPEAHAEGCLAAPSAPKEG